MNSQTKRTFIVAGTIEIANRGVAVFFEGDPPITLPLGRRPVAIVTPAGDRIETSASCEAALLLNHQEALAMLFSDIGLDSIPAGSTVVVLVEEP